jgi:hypothetical protein
MALRLTILKVNLELIHFPFPNPVEWRKPQNEELDDLYSSPTIVRVMNSRRMIWAGHVAHIGQGRCVQGFGEKT